MITQMDDKTKVLLDRLGKELLTSITAAWLILQRDANCPPELTNLIAIMHNSK